MSSCEGTSGRASCSLEGGQDVVSNFLAFPVWCRNKWISDCWAQAPPFSHCMRGALPCFQCWRLGCASVDDASEMKHYPRLLTRTEMSPKGKQGLVWAELSSGLPLLIPPSHHALGGLEVFCLSHMKEGVKAEAVNAGMQEGRKVKISFC